MSRRRLAGSKSSTTSTPRRPSCAPLAPEQRRRRPAGEEMKLKQLEGLLGGLTQFPAPKVGTPPPPPRLARLPFPSPARFWEVGKSGGSILLLPLGRLCGCRWSWSSTRRALTSRRGCSTRSVLRLHPAPIPMLCPALLREGRMPYFSSRDGSGDAMRVFVCGATCEWNYGIGCQCHQVHSFGSASTELLH